MTRKIVDVEPPQPPFSNYSSISLRTWPLSVSMKIQSLRERYDVFDVFLDAKEDTIR